MKINIISGREMQTIEVTNKPIIISIGGERYFVNEKPKFGSHFTKVRNKDKKQLIDVIEDGMD